MIICVMLLLLALPGSVFAADRYVSKTGNNANPCTAAQPCLTIGRGVDVLNEGDTLYVGSGDYNEDFGNQFKDNITIARAPGAPTKPVVNASIRFENSAFGVTVDGFRVDGNNRSDCYCVWIADGPGAYDVTLKNCELIECCGQGVLAGGERHLYQENYWEGCGGDDIEHDHCIYLNGIEHHLLRNYVSRGNWYNVQCSQGPGPGCYNTLMDGNVWTGSRQGVTWDGGSGNIFRNNISFNDSTNDPGKAMRAHGAQGLRVLNNTFVNNGVYIRNQAGENTANTEIAGNIFVGGYNIENESPTTNAHNNLFSNPGLTGPPTPTSPGHRLLSTSTAAIGQAPCRSDVPNDVDGNTRPQQGTCDLGADEFTGTIVESPLHLGWIQEPSNVVVNTNMSPALRIEVHQEDHSVVTTGADSTASITLSRIAGTGCETLNCGAGGCTKNAVAGVTTYSTVQFNTVGTGCQLQVSAAFNTRAAETLFDVEPGGVTPILTDMIFSPPPSSDTVGVAITPTVEVLLRDQLGAPFLGTALLVTLSIATGPVGAVLSNNTATTNTGTGRATFTNLSLNLTGTYTLQAVASGVPAITSTSFTIDPVPTGLPRLVLSSGANKRYFISATTGQPIFMAGTHTWTVFQDRPPNTVIDFPALMTKFGSNWDSPQGGLAKHRLLRFWMSEKAINEQLVTPNPFMEDGPGGDFNFGPSAGNCTLSNPDQPRFNQAYFDRMATRIAQAKAAGVYIAVMLFQGWSHYDKGYTSAWPTHWFHPDKNCNGIDGNPNSFAQDQGYREGMATTTRPPMKGGPARTVNNHDTIWRIQLAYVKKVIDTIHSPAAGGGDNVLYEIANEDGWWSSDWQDDMINEIHAYEARTAAGACGGQTCKAHLVGKTWMECENSSPYPDSGCGAPNDFDDNTLTNSPADWTSRFQAAYYPDGDHNPEVAPASKPDISDSDHGYIGAGFGGFTPERIWKFFFRGYNLWFMDDWTLMTDTTWLAHRRALGHTVAYADKVNMTNMVAQNKGTGSPASSGYSLVNAAAGHYMALKLGGTLTFAVPNGTYSCEWFDIDNRVVQSCGTVTTTPGTQPFTNAVLLMKSTAAMEQTLTSIEYITPPNDENVNTAMNPAVTLEVQDQDGLAYTTAPVAVELRIYNNPGGIVVTNGTATTSAATGRATLAPSINLPGTYRFRAVALEGGVDVTDTISANSFVISSAEPLPTTLTFAPPHGVQPSTTAQGATIIPPVKLAVLDQNGALYTTTSIIVTLSLDTFPAGAVLTSQSGQLAKPIVGGLVEFNDLSLNIPDANYRLKADTALGLLATSSTFAITAPVISLGTIGERATRGLFMAQ